MFDYGLFRSNAGGGFEQVRDFIASSTVTSAPASRAPSISAVLS